MWLYVKSIQCAHILPQGQYCKTCHSTVPSGFQLLSIAHTCINSFFLVVELVHFMVLYLLDIWMNGKNLQRNILLHVDFVSFCQWATQCVNCLIWTLREHLLQVPNKHKEAVYSHKDATRCLIFLCFLMHVCIAHIHMEISFLTEMNICGLFWFFYFVFFFFNSTSSQKLTKDWYGIYYMYRNWFVIYWQVQEYLYPILCVFVFLSVCYGILI
jgi:hypothetical protein